MKTALALAALAPAALAAGLHLAQLVDRQDGRALAGAPPPVVVSRATLLGLPVGSAVSAVAGPAEAAVTSDLPREPGAGRSG